MVELDTAMLTRKPDELSGGQQQRVALARALARKPALMLLDEPFSALDTGLRETVRQAVGRVLSRAGITALLVTHDLAEALSFAEQLAVMRDGRLMQSGRPDQLYWRPEDPRTALFLGEGTLIEAEIGDGFISCPLGRLPAATAGRHGFGTILLRPEQIVIGPSRTGGVGATVESVSFGGSRCFAQLRLETGSAPLLLAAQVESLRLPAVGAAVSVEVRGDAWLLPRADAGVRS
jgi:iron(III) transport system ATP-binding protein